MAPSTKERLTDAPLSQIRVTPGRTSKRRASKMRSGDSLSPIAILSASYLNGYLSKKDLVQRLQKIVKTLEDLTNNDDDETGPDDYPSLAGLASILVEDRYLLHRDKDIRLYTALACMEIFVFYAPEPPYDEGEILKIFPQIVRQLSSLAVGTSQVHIQLYYKLLERFAEIKIGCVLVELTRTLDSSDKFTQESDDEGEEDARSNDGHKNNKFESPTAEDALEVLAELIRSILQSVSIEHPSEVSKNSAMAVSACIDEFDGTIPITILDEILACVSMGPVVSVTNPAFVKATAAIAASKKRGKKIPSKKLPPRMIQQTNQSYLVAASIIRRTEDRISTPMANLLNGLLNADAAVVDKTNIAAWDEQQLPKKTISKESKNGIIDLDGTADRPSPPNVWSIIYELHKVSPQILTTVIGTVAISLKSPDTEKRLRVTKLLGRLFYSRTSDIATKFHACYREWVRRTKDVDEEIRKTMISCLIMVLRNRSNEEMLRREATDALIHLVKLDPSNDIRIECVHSICNLVHNNGGKEESTSSVANKAIISSRLLKAVGNRVSSKHKSERRDAVTGLAQIYHRHYVRERLRKVQNEGDDCDIDIILHTIHVTCSFERQEISVKSPHIGRQSNKQPMYENEIDHYDLDEKYKFIPRLVFESACFTDGHDTEMRNRVVQIVDDVLLGSGTGSNVMTPTARALGLAMILNTIEDRSGRHDTSQSNAFKWMQSLLIQRAKLQHAIVAYIDARSRAEQCRQGSEEKLSADSVALEKLEFVASLSAPISTSGGTDDLQTILRKVHSARDKHIFRLLASISSPTHSPSARSRAFDELPKRMKSLGTSAVSWMKSLARRSAMGNLFNVEAISHCTLLAQEAYHERDLEAAMAFLKCVKIAVNVYPSLCGTKEGFANLVELFGDCRSPQSPELKKEIDQSEMVTTLSGILAVAAPARAVPPQLSASQDIVAAESEGTPTVGTDVDFESELFRLCTKDGTPEQSRHAVYTLAGLTKKKQNDHASTNNSNEVFGRLLETVAAPTRLSLGNKKIMSVFATLGPLVECMPQMFIHSGKEDDGKKAVSFALNSLLLGNREVDDGDSANYEKDSDSSDEDSDNGTRKNRTFTSMKNRKKTKKELDLSFLCQRACAAIDFLVTHIRSIILYQRKESDSTTRTTAGSDSDCMPSSEHISTVIKVLVGIVQDAGLLPSERDRDGCKSDADRAALRQCAAINLFRLSDGSLQFGNELITYEMWHILSSTFLDEEKSVRESIMEELIHMLKGTGKYCQGFAPSLRFLACVTLCPDTDHTHSSNNGHAANVGRLSNSVKSAALECITSLRRTCESTSLQCRAMSRAAEKNFEKNLKVRLMPEFAVPFAFHLLAFRPETPSAGGTGIMKSSKTSKKRSKEDNVNDEELMEEEGQHKMLSKRLRWLLEPLIQSLGESADNISFLLRLTELIGNKFRPVSPFKINSHSQNSKSPSSPNISTLDLSLDSFLAEDELKQDQSSHAKLKVISATARQVLLKFVKKDVNLTQYPGSIQIPGALFVRSNFSLPGKTVEIKDNETSSVSDVDGKIDEGDSDTDASFMDENDYVSPKEKPSLGELHLSPIPQSRSPSSLAPERARKTITKESDVNSDIDMEDYDAGESLFEGTPPAEKECTSVGSGKKSTGSISEKDIEKDQDLHRKKGTRKSSRTHVKNANKGNGSKHDTVSITSVERKEKPKKSESIDGNNERVEKGENSTKDTFAADDDSTMDDSPFEEMTLSIDTEKKPHSHSEKESDKDTDNAGDPQRKKQVFETSTKDIDASSSSHDSIAEDTCMSPNEELSIDSEKKSDSVPQPLSEKDTNKTEDIHRKVETRIPSPSESVSEDVEPKEDNTTLTTGTESKEEIKPSSTTSKKLGQSKVSNNNKGTVEIDRKEESTTSNGKDEDVQEKVASEDDYKKLNRKRKSKSVAGNSTVSNELKKKRKTNTSSPVKILVGNNGSKKTRRSRYAKKAKSVMDELDFSEGVTPTKKKSKSFKITRKRKVITTPKIEAATNGENESSSISSKRPSLATPVTPRRKRRKKIPKIG